MFILYHYHDEIHGGYRILIFLFLFYKKIEIYISHLNVHKEVQYEILIFILYNIIFFKIFLT